MKDKKTLCAEWIEQKKLYRLFEEISPAETVAYEEDIKTAEDEAIENGYNELVIK